MLNGNESSDDPYPVRHLLEPVDQHVADEIVRQLGQEPVSVALLRMCAEKAVHDLRLSISPESLPDMATQLTLVRLAYDSPADDYQAMTGMLQNEYRTHGS